MTTKRFTLDSKGQRAYVGSKVYYKNKIWLLEDIQYVTWNSNQYLTLQAIDNKNKRLKFIAPNNIIAAR